VLERFTRANLIFSSGNDQPATLLVRPLHTPVEPNLDSMMLVHAGSNGFGQFDGIYRQFRCIEYLDCKLRIKCFIPLHIRPGARWRELGTEVCVFSTCARLAQKLMHLQQVAADFFHVMLTIPMDDVSCGA
jgi:hypothetical protein